MFEKKRIDASYFKTKGFYAFFIPVKVPYKQIYSLADKAGLQKKDTFGPIIERGKMFGFGWIGVEVNKPSMPRDDVVAISGEFETYVHTGPYKTIGTAYKKIMKSRPAAKEFYNLYLDDPEKVSPEQCRTQIYFK